MARIASILLGSLAMAAATRSFSVGTSLRRGKQFGKMNPEAVAHTLSGVEAKWMTEAVAFAECNSTDAACQDDTMHEFKSSCSTVVKSLLQGSDGDKSNVQEYLGDICGQEELHGWKKDMCYNFASAFSKVLTDDNLVNRDDLPVDSICSNFLTRGFLKDAAKDEVARAKKEKEEAIAAAEAEAKKEAEKAAEIKEQEVQEAKEQEAAAKAEAAKEAAELSAKMREEAQAKADEAKEKAAEAANATAIANANTSVPAVNSSVDASSDPIATKNNTAPEPAVPEQAVVAATNTTASAGANSTQSAATTVSSNTTK